jgi:hypothetical protein
MTPKEKAIELVEKFSSVLMHDEVYEDSIKCALIAVQKVINALDVNCWQNADLIIYWNEVKQEIEKL